MALEGTYAPPGVYTNTEFNVSSAQDLQLVRVPVLIGTGLEILTQTGLEVVRGSSSQVGVRVPQEDQTGRAVVSFNSITGQVVLGAFDGTRRRFQVRNFPLSTPDGLPDPSVATVSVTVDGQPTLVLSLDTENGIVEISDAPAAGATVQATYFFNREDTLTTDTVSDQVSTESAILFGGLAGPYTILEGQNDVFAITVNRNAEVLATIPEGTWTAAQVAAVLNSSVPGLTAAAYTDNLNQTAVRLQATESLLVGVGSANTALGFNQGQRTFRNQVFYTYQGPIVDGTNGGVATTSVSDIEVRVNGVVVAASSVDGQTRAVTLPYPPAVGSTVTIRYFFNTWQDTFDYLANIGVTEILQVGLSPDRNDFIPSVDFTLVDDKVVWGTASIVMVGETTPGSTFFGDTQINSTLVDNRTFLTECTAVTDTSVTPARDSAKEFRLPFLPTTGNGRNSPLGAATFNAVANGRVDLPTNRPDLVQAYWGYGIQDAIDRGPVPVTRVESTTSTITLRDPVPVGATVYATFYYNTLQDTSYSVECILAGTSGVGQYRVLDTNGAPLYAARFHDKDGALATVAINFPSGSELQTDARLESPIGDATGFTGPVEEVVSVEFSDRDETPAIYVYPGSGPYFPVSTLSDRLGVTIDGATTQTTTPGVSLTIPAGVGNGIAGTVVGNPVVYDPATGSDNFVIVAGVNDTLDLTIDGVAVSVTLTAGTVDLGDVADDINAEVATARPRVVAPTRFGSYRVVAGEFDGIALRYTGEVTGSGAVITATLAPGTYASPALLAAEIETQINAAIAAEPEGWAVFVTADSQGRMVFDFVLDGTDATGYWQFQDTAENFATILGLGSGTASAVVINAPVARVVTVPTSSGRLFHDRLVLRNRIFPGSVRYATESQAYVRVDGGTAASLLGLPSGVRANAYRTATVQPATVFLTLGYLDGQDTTDEDIQVVFYDGTGAAERNNTLDFVIDGAPVSVSFTASATGTATTIASVLSTLTSEVGANGTVSREGDGIRVTSVTAAASSRIEFGSGSANSRFGIADGAVYTRTGVTASAVVSALMNHTNAAPADLFLDYATTTSYFPDQAVAYVVRDTLNAEYVAVQSLTGGIASSVVLTAVNADINRMGTGLLGTAGSGATGEDALTGFFVTSSNPNGSGSANTSVLNDGVGQDGVVGATYRDAVTGLTFTILPRAGGSTYPTAAAFRLRVSATQTTNANVPLNVIPGVELLVSNTLGVTPTDTATVQTMNRSGAEPGIGDLYYVSYNYRKEDFSTRIYTRLSSIVREFGPVSPDNPVSLAAFLMFQNGAILTAITQVPKDTGSRGASQDSYIAAVDSLEGTLPGLISPSILVPLTPATPQFAVFMGLHCDVQSSTRYRSERTCVLGFGAGTIPKAARDLAQNVRRSRVRVVYPDLLRMSLTDPVGNTSSFLVDGTMMAAASVGQRVSPLNDVATPWTRSPIIGFDSIARILDEVAMNELAVGGVTVVEQVSNGLRIRHGLTTDMRNVLTRTPTVLQIADDVQISTRRVLDRFIGTKYVGSVLTQIEGRTSQMFKTYVQQSIVRAYRGIAATSDADDPTTANLEGFYQPVFPLLYIQVQYTLQSRLDS